MCGEMARIIYEVRPRFVFVENSPMLTSRGLGRVLGDLASMGFDARWGVLGAADVGANHQRDRIWIVAKWRGQLPHTQHNRIRRWEQQQKSTQETPRNMAHSDSGMCGGWGTVRQSRADSVGRLHIKKTQQTKYDLWCKTFGCNSLRGKKEKQNSWWEIEPNLDRVADGVAARGDRLKAIGKGQVPLCSATAWQILTGR